jgi:hypothetical protein
MEKMKKFICLLLALCMVFLLASCDSGSSDKDDKDRTVDPFPAIVVEPYLPEEFAGFTQVALYKSDLDIDTDEIEGVEYVTKDLTCIYLFDDSSFVSTSTEIYINKSTGVKDDTLTEKEPLIKGTYTLTGDKANGTLHMNETHEWDDDHDPGHWEPAGEPEIYNTTIKGGVFTLTEGIETIRFTLSN